MYIAPDSTIRLLSNIPIDKNQSDTLWFATMTDQINYFVSKTVAIFTEQTYQRINRGYCRLNVNAEAVYACNYMMFQNTSFGSKWFYAFIDKVEYINNAVTEIQFTIDPIQTWFFNFNIRQCFVERCTPSSDNVGDNLLPEPVQLGEYVINNNDYSVIGLDTRELCFIVVIDDPGHDANFYGGGLYNNVVSAARYYAFALTTSGLNAFNDIVLNSNPVKQAPEAMLMLYIAPKKLCGLSDPQLVSTNILDHAIGMSTTQINTAYPLTALNPDTMTLNGYSPRNKKCFTYPYTFFNIDNGQGQSMILRYEFFDNLQPKVRVGGNLTYPVELTCFPYEYKGSPSAVAPDFGEYRLEKLAIKGFPQGSWSMDAYSAWLAQNSVPMVIDAMKASVPIMANLAVGNEIGGALGILDAVSNVAKSYYQASIAADIVKGSIQTGSNDASAERLVFKGGCMTLPYTIIRNIDSFFDAFGYAQNRIMDVNTHARTRWTYVKTIGANVDGALPSEDATYIANCFDRGIRFWSDTANPQSYTANNAFLS